jgi:glucuronosyltransferase
VQLFVSSGGQRHIENAIHHSVPVLGLSVTTQLEHYLHQIVKYGAGTVSYIDFETKQSFVELVQSVVGNRT